MSLSEKQINAAHRLGQDVCVVAGPGSGKTSVLIERFCWLVRECTIAPERILAITFTEKAATEIKQRLVTAFLNDYGTREPLSAPIIHDSRLLHTLLMRTPSQKESIRCLRWPMSRYPASSGATSCRTKCWKRSTPKSRSGCSASSAHLR